MISKKKLIPIGFLVVVILSVVASTWFLNGAKAATRPRYLVIVHGLGDTIYSKDMQSVRSWFQKQGYYDDIYLPEYYTSVAPGESMDPSTTEGLKNCKAELYTSIKDYGRILASKLETHFKNLPDGDIDIVAHSMGGLVVRAMMKYYISIDKYGNARLEYTARKKIGSTYIDYVYYKHRIDDIVLIGTPNRGTSLAKYVIDNINTFKPLITLLGYLYLSIDVNLGSEYFKYLGCLLLVISSDVKALRQVKDMVPYSSFLNSLNSGDQTPSNANWYLVRGTKEISTLDFGVKKVSNDEIFGAGANDGIVDYGYTSITGLKAKKTYVYNHVEIFIKTDVLSYIFSNWLAEGYTPSSNSGSTPNIG